jgi:transposase
LSEQGHIDLYYGDESGVSLDPSVPYAWQFADEQVSMPTAKGGNINCLALLSRDNHCLAQTTPKTITGNFVAEQLDHLSLCLQKPTVIVLDNASIHHGQAMQHRRQAWQARGLFVFYLPSYSPHLNIAEVLWRKLKYEWLRPEDYANKETLHYQVWLALKAVGQSLRIAFSPFRLSEGIMQT